MNEALEFILNASATGKGSEIFIPKLKSYDMSTLIESLGEIFGEIKQDNIGIRPGEKLHETLINHDEILYAWKINDMYMLANPHYRLFNDNDILGNYNGIEKIRDMDTYSSDLAEKISGKELKEKILELNLV
tara:strand:- start:783 stop:1178 length:396 start_codon:yes stop_codon:yes gene_type:complete